MNGHRNGRVIFLLGPTAIGKSAAALALARRLPVEIISADSVMVYRGMDIGSAKPDLAERNTVPHHLIDILEPDQPWSAAAFCEAAGSLIDDILSRERIPVVAGGSMLYVHALQQGLSPLPKADPVLRAELEAEAAIHGWPALHRQLTELDPLSAAAIDPRQGRRVQRALEICRLTGQTASSLRQRRRGGLVEQGYEIRNIALVPAQRSEHRERIESRLHRMLDAGLVGEVQRLRAAGYRASALPSQRAVVYRQVHDWLEGVGDEQQMIARCISANNRLVRGQLNWLRRWSMPLSKLEICGITETRMDSLSVRQLCDML